MAVEKPVVDAPSGAPPVPDGVPINTVKEDLTEKLQASETALAEVLAEQKAKGEISAASESTMQALMEQIKLLNDNMKVLDKISQAQNLVPLKLVKKWWEDLLPF